MEMVVGIKRALFTLGSIPARNSKIKLNRIFKYDYILYLYLIIVFYI